MIQKETYGSDSQREGAFTLTDLTAVLAVLAILGALQWTSLANTKGNSRGVGCLYNHRQLMRAWELFAQDNGGTLVGNLDGANAQNIANSNRTWVLGWFDFNGGNAFPAAFGGSADTNTYVLTQLSPLASYLGQTATVFKCPSDTSLSMGSRGAPRVRSYSINGYLGNNQPYTSGYKDFKSLSEVISPKPSKAFVFIDEREDSINDCTLLLDMSGFDPPSIGSYRMVDFPSDWHNRGANLSFVDGHTETWRWQDRRTMPVHQRGQLLPLNVSSPNNPDVARIQTAASRRINSSN